MKNFLTVLATTLTLSAISISNIPEIVSNSTLMAKETNTDNNYHQFYLQTHDEIKFNVISTDTVEIELPKIFNLFKDLIQIVKESNKKLQVTYASGFFLTDDRNYLNPGEFSLDVLANIESLANSNYVELKSVKLRIAVRNQQYFRVFLHYKIADLEQKLELFDFALDDVLLEQKLFGTFFSLSYNLI